MDSLVVLPDVSRDIITYFCVIAESLSIEGGTGH